MGRTSDYTKQVRNEEYENIAETTKKNGNMECFRLDRLCFISVWQDGL